MPRRSRPAPPPMEVHRDLSDPSGSGEVHQMQFPRHLPAAADRPITTLYMGHWTPGNAARRYEIDECLRRNIDCRAIDRIVLLAQSTPEHRASVPKSDKIVWVEFLTGIDRPRYLHFFEAINACTTTPWDINIVANSDVFFDESIEVLKPLNLFGVCIALSRWEYRGGQVCEHAGDNSQDCWIFQGPVRPAADSTDTGLGIFCCDWRIAWVLRHNDYRLINVPHDVRHYHMHDSGVRNNGSKTPGPLHEHIPHTRLADCNLPVGRHDRGGVLAFSLFGDQPKYCVGAVENAKLAKWLYPDWTVRVYVDGSVPGHVVDALRSAAAEVVQRPQWNGWHGGALWRLLAIDDPGFVHWGIRDTDSRLTYRERVLIEDWLDSGFPLHAVRDHPNHQRPVILCAFDGQRAAIRDMAGHIDAWRSYRGDEYGSDEYLIADRLWPSIRERTLVHAELDNCLGAGGVIRPFPTKREEGFRFVGERIYEDNMPNGDDRDYYVASRMAADAAGAGAAR